MIVPYLQQIELLPVEIIQDFRKTGKSNAIPDKLKHYIIEIDAVMQIREEIKTDSIARIAKALMSRFPHLIYKTARERVYDAYNFFHVNDTISEDVWLSIYADKMEDLAKLCIAKGKEEEARRAWNDALEMRMRSKTKLRPEDFKGNTYIVSIDIKPEDLGFERSNLKEIAKREVEGHYNRLINSLHNVSEEEKKRLRVDADITDAEIINDGDD